MAAPLLIDVCVQEEWAISDSQRRGIAGESWHGQQTEEHECGAGAESVVHLESIYWLGKWPYGSFFIQNWRVGNPPSRGHGAPNIPVQLYELVSMVAHPETDGPGENSIPDLAQIFQNDIDVVPGAGNNSSDTIHRLKEGVARFLITNISGPTKAIRLPDVATMWDIPTLNHHDPAGGNVLFLDGHAEFRACAGARTFPISNSLESAFAWGGVLP